MRILFYGLNYSPEVIGIGKYSGEMIQSLADQGHECVVVTTPPYYPQWKVSAPYSAKRYRREYHEPKRHSASQMAEESFNHTSKDLRGGRQSRGVSVIRCPVWVPRRVNGLRRMIHLASFGLSSMPVLLWKALRFRPDIIMTVEPAACCMPVTRLAGRLCKAKTWLQVQDFEVDAAFELGILKSKASRKIVMKLESMLMRRFDVVSSISRNMLDRLRTKGVQEHQIRMLPNWVDCDTIYPMQPDTQSGETLQDMKRSLRKRFGIPNDVFVALYAGNVGAKQGLNIVADAAKLLEQQRLAGRLTTDIHFVICGNGAAYSAFKTAVEGVDRVQLLPVQTAEHFNALMNCADVHLLPQKSGAADLVMPSKLTGMLAVGRPVIACADPGTQIARVVNGQGLVVPPGDADAFAQALVELANDPERCDLYGKSARHYAIEHLGRDAILSKLHEDLYVLLGRAQPSTHTALPETKLQPVGASGLKEEQTADLVSTEAAQTSS